MNDLFLHDSSGYIPCCFFRPHSLHPDVYEAPPLYLQEIGSLQAKKPHTSSRTHLSSYLFFCVNSGSGELSIRERNIS